MRNVFLFASLFVFGLVLPAAADDFPQWRGPNRNGISAEKGLLQEWPAEGPKLDWQVDGLGDGYSTPSIADGRIFLINNQGLEDEYVQASASKMAR